MSENLVWDVALLSPPYATLTYLQPEDFPDTAWKAGQRVVVEVGRSVRLGLLLDRVDLKPPRAKMKALLWPGEARPLFPPAFLRLLQALSARYVVSPGRVLAAVLPGQIKAVGKTLTDGQGLGIDLRDLVALKPEERRFWVRQWTVGNLAFHLPSPKRSSAMWSVACSPPWPLRPQAKRQQDLLNHLWTHGAKSRQMLVRDLGDWAGQALKKLQDKGLVAVQADGGPQSEPETTSALDRVRLTREQEQVVADLSRDLLALRPCTRLLFGVTGSGKTMVYASLARTCLHEGRSVLLLVPEVALALHIHAQIAASIPEVETILYHGSLPAARRSELYTRMSRDEGPVLVVGTRSAVFLPRQDWGLIVLDEEHDTSFKQEERLAYQAKEVAYFLSLEHKALLLLGSATPDIKTFHACQQGDVGLVSLPSRISGQELPAVHVVDLLQHPAEDGPFSPQCRKALDECLQRGEQAIILLNRRGYAPLVYCTSCAQVLRCEHCAVGLTYHKKLERLVCHYCGGTRPFPSPCPGCGGHQFVPMSEGTEQIEEYLHTRLDPEVGALRLDRDSTRPQGSMEDILERFHQGQAQVLVGTQMCSKGHHFPRVTLVIVLDGDVGLNLPDYRATERSFQLLVQVAGRAGRGEKPGTVYIQTRNPDHYCWRFVQEYDFEGFYHREIALRQRMRYPPFVKLALVRFSYPAGSAQDGQRVKDLGHTLRQQGQAGSVQVLGPAPAPLSQLRGRIRYQCLLKAQSWVHIRSLFTHFLAAAKDRGQCRISLDLDPVQML